MKKWLSAVIIFVICCLPFTSFAFEKCVIGAPDFCRCFVNNCKQVLPASQCTYANLNRSLRDGMIAPTCRREQPANYQQCVAASQYYISGSGAALCS